MAWEETMIMEIFLEKILSPRGTTVYVIPKLLTVFLHLSFAVKDFLVFFFPVHTL